MYTICAKEDSSLLRRRSKKDIIRLSIVTWSVSLPTSPYTMQLVRDLVVDFDQYLSFHNHIRGICKSTHFHLRGIGRIRNLLTFDATAQLIHALTTTRLDFCNSILYNIPKRLKYYNRYRITQVLLK